MQVVNLVRDPNQATILVVASDGLWDAVDKLPDKLNTFAQYIADHLLRLRHTKGLYQTLSIDLTRWASGLERDDVTVAVRYNIC